MQQRTTIIQNKNIIQSKYQPRKYESTKPSISNNTGSNNSKIVGNNNNNQHQIYHSKISSNHITDRIVPELKYYVRCPNCNYLLNDESAFNSIHAGINNSGYFNRRNSYGTYEKKIYTNIENKNKNIINNNDWRSKDYYQKSGHNLKNDKVYNPPTNNVKYYESYGTSKKVK